MISRLLIISVILVSCNSSKQEDNITTVDKTNDETVVDNVEEPTDLIAKDSCLNLLTNVNMTKIKELTERFTTSTILGKEERNNFSIDETGTVGLYNLFCSYNKEIIKLGELIVYTKSDPDNWKMFDENERILSIELISSAYNIDEKIKVGAGISDVLQENSSINKISDDLYQYKDDCEIWRIKVEDNIISSVKVRVK